MDGPPLKLLTLRIGWERWSPAAPGQFPIGRLLKPMPLKQKLDAWRQHEVEFCVVEEHGCGIVGRSAIWIRHCRHLGHHWRPITSLRTIVEKLGNHGFHCNLGNGRRCDARGDSWRTLWTARQLANHG